MDKLQKVQMQTGLQQNLLLACINQEKELQPSSPLKRKSIAGRVFEEQADDLILRSRAIKRSCAPVTVREAALSSRTSIWVDSQINTSNKLSPSHPNEPPIEPSENPDNRGIPISRANLQLLFPETSADSTSPTSSEMSQLSDNTRNEFPSVVKSTHSGYETALKLRGIYSLSPIAPRPGNFDEITRALASTRNSPSPTDIAAQNFPKRVGRSGNESAAKQAILPAILPVISSLWDSDRDALQTDQQWDRQTLLGGDLQPDINPPQPDQALGFHPDIFPFPQATVYMKHAMSPAQGLAWPYFTIEAKGPQGRLNVAILQNANSAAIMLNNMYQLKQAVSKEHESYQNILVMTMAITTESISLYGHFLVKNTSGNLNYHSTCLSSNSARDPSGRSYKEAYRDAMNAVETFRKKTLDWISTDMALLEEKLVSLGDQQLNLMTPCAGEQKDISPKDRGDVEGGNLPCRNLLDKESPVSMKHESN